MKLFLGVDGGGTKTEMVVCDSSGHELARFTGGSTNPHGIGFEAAAAELTALLACAVMSSPAQSASSYCVLLGMAGVGTAEERCAISSAVSAFFSKKRIEADVTVTSDAEIALMATLGREHGVLVIAGTGSIVFGCTPQGQRFRVGGWGHLLGDEGSGYRVGLDTLQAVMRSYDEVCPSTAITQLIMKAFDFGSIAELKGYIYQPSIKKQDIADFARFTIEASRTGDETAQQIIQRNATELAGHTIALMNKNDWFQQSDLVLNGSIFKHSPLYNETFRRHIAAAFPQLSLHDALHSPAFGAALLAVKQATQ